MSTEWIELKTGKEVFDRAAEGWEIELLNADIWTKWGVASWSAGWKFRGRPPQPKTKTVTSECWRNSISGNLCWALPSSTITEKNWQRFSAGDIAGEVEE